jgi:hypothetical protein
MVEGPCSVERYYADFQPIEQSRAGVVLKARECYLSARRAEALVEAVVIEGRRPQSFFVALSQRKDGVMVKLLLLTDPEKTDGVKSLLAAVGKQLKGQHPDCRYGQTNLHGFLEE